MRFKLKPEVIYEVKKRFYNEEEFGSIFKWEGIKQKCLVAQLKPKKIREFKKLERKYEETIENTVDTGVEKDISIPSGPIYPSKIIAVDMAPNPSKNPDKLNKPIASHTENFG